MSSSNDVAIVGLSCRTAGGVDNLDSLWDFLLEKKHASGEIPRNRWEPWQQRSVLDAKILDGVIRKGYFLDDLEGFDAAFFGISPKEAVHMDPHQRLGLELVYEALENAGIRPDKLAGSDTAVYMGVDSDDYSRILMEDLPAIEAWSGISTAHHGISNRISYHLDLRGPSTAVDAACASSLVALHLAHQAIVSGESTVAICGGVNVICAPGITHMLQKAGALTADGVCRSFDAAADGYARGEGGAIIILKRLSAAREDNDEILAVLKGSASAQDGRTRGIMAPNGAAQVDVARRALYRAGNIDPRTVDYVEAHATSTPLGDPVEIKAMVEVYGSVRSPENPCYLGSIKPNVGHLEAAAGAISVVKTVLSLQRGVIPPQTLLENLNINIDWATSGLEVVREARMWPDNGVRRAAVCSYGYGGSVCHAIIEQAPSKLMQKPGSRSRTSVLLTLSAKQRERLPDHAASLAHWLSTQGASEDMSAVARTLTQRRIAYDHRLCVDASNHEGAIRSLRSFAMGTPDARITSGRATRSAALKGVVWVFSGHGAQWPSMGKQLLLNSVFRDKLVELDIVFQREAGISSIEALRQGMLGGSNQVQILTYAVQIGLAFVLQAEGVAPQAIIGHSVGEISAAVMAGCLTSEEGAIIVSRRANLLTQVQGHGAMVLVALPFEEAAAQLDGREGIVAAIKPSPATCVVSGRKEDVETYLRQLRDRGIKTWRVKTDIAFHSPLLNDLARDLQGSLQHVLHPRPSVIPIYSTSDPNPRTGALRDAGYWTRNTVAPVRLTDAVDSAVEDGFRVFLEISSHPIVSQSIHETLEARHLSECASFGVMSYNVSCDRSIAQAISQLYTLGVLVDFSTQLGNGPWSNRLPNTPWIHKPYWKIPSFGPRPCVQQHDVDKHTFLGGLVEVAGSDTSVWTTTLSESTKPYPFTHKLGATEIVPAAVYCNSLRDAASARCINDLKLHVPISITTEKRELQVVLQGSRIWVSSRTQAYKEVSGSKMQKHAWVKHCTAEVALSDIAPYQHLHSIAGIRERMTTRLPNSFAKDCLGSIGVSTMAFPWSVLEHLANHKEMLVQVDMQSDIDTLPWDPRSWAPLVDAAMSVSSCILSKSTTMRIISGIDKVVFVSKDNPPKTGYLLIERGFVDGPQRIDVDVLNRDGTRICRLEGIQFNDVEPEPHAIPCVDALLHRLEWVRPAFCEAPLPIRNAVLIAPSGLDSTTYIQDLEPKTHKLLCVSSVQRLTDPRVEDVLTKSNTIVLYIPDTVKDGEDVTRIVHAAVCDATNILSALVRAGSKAKMFVLLNDMHNAQCLGRVPYRSLYGFSRVAASEHPDTWGGLIDHEGTAFPLFVLQHMREQTVVRLQADGPRVARMKCLSIDTIPAEPPSSLLPRSNGTYVITGGLGGVGMEVLEFLVEKGARSIVVVSRRLLPPRHEWSAASGSLAMILERIQRLETRGTTIHTLQLDISSRGASHKLVSALKHLSPLPVLGVVHAAAVPGFGYIRDTDAESYASVMAPKIAGTLALHEAFPPGTLDFCVFFSSISGIVGTLGHSAYAASNAFLDGIAEYRRLQGCNSIAILWTVWRGLGLASDTAVVDSELQAAGMKDITSAEAFQAWQRLSGFNTDHAVVTRLQTLDADEPAPNDLIREVVPRRIASKNRALAKVEQLTASELEGHIKAVTRNSLSLVLDIDQHNIDDETNLIEIGMDSFVGAKLQQILRKELPNSVPVPRSLFWDCSTVGDLTSGLSKNIKEILCS